MRFNRTSAGSTSARSSRDFPTRREAFRSRSPGRSSSTTTGPNGGPWSPPCRSTSSGDDRDSRAEGFWMRWPFRRTALERTIWTVIVWFLFGLFVLGPSATVFAFSFTSSVLRGAGPFTLQWYALLLSPPVLIGPLFRSLLPPVFGAAFRLAVRA